MRRERPEPSPANERLWTPEGRTLVPKLTAVRSQTKCSYRDCAAYSTWCASVPDEISELWPNWRFPKHYVCEAHKRLTVRVRIEDETEIGLQWVFLVPSPAAETGH
jgi:hypothetical protein